MAYGERREDIREVFDKLAAGEGQLDTLVPNATY